jgi:hypothetical protein
MANRFKKDKQNRPRCDKCGHFHQKKEHRSVMRGTIIRCIAISDRLCIYCCKVALYPENSDSVEGNLTVCDIHRNKICKHCPNKEYRHKGVCKLHMCQSRLGRREGMVGIEYQFIKCSSPTGSYTTYCRHHSRHINKLCRCGRVPPDRMFLGILYHRRIISRDIFHSILKYVHWNHSPCRSCLHKSRNK